MKCFCACRVSVLYAPGVFSQRAAPAAWISTCSKNCGSSSNVHSTSSPAMEKWPPAYDSGGERAPHADHAGGKRAARRGRRTAKSISSRDRKEVGAVTWSECIYEYDGSFSGLLCCIFDSYTRKNGRFPFWKPAGNRFRCMPFTLWKRTKAMQSAFEQRMRPLCSNGKADPARPSHLPSKPGTADLPPGLPAVP